VLHDVSLDFPAGSFVRHRRPHRQRQEHAAVLLLRFYVPRPDASTSTAAARATIGDAHFREAVGLVPQEPFLLAASARENIDMGRGLPDADDRGRGTGGTRARLHPPSWSTATTRRWAKAARACRWARSS
jgi:ATP-binding cassette, subfamily B, multidrug efflux pump